MVPFVEIDPTIRNSPPEPPPPTHICLSRYAGMAYAIPPDVRGSPMALAGEQ